MPSARALAHMLGTLRLCRLLLPVQEPWISMEDLLRRKTSISRSSEGDDGIKYDLYYNHRPGRSAWGLTISDLYEEAYLEDVRRWMLLHLPAVQVERLLSLASLKDGRTGHVLAVGQREGSLLPKIKFYLQENQWDASGLTAGRLAAVTGPLGIVIPSWIGRIGVAALSAHPDGSTELKLYIGVSPGGEGALPARLQELSRRMDVLSPADGDVKRYATVRLFPGREPSYSVNKIYNTLRLGFHAGLSEQKAAWADVSGLFQGAGEREAFQALRQRLLSTRGLLVLPTATAIDEEGGGVDLYLAGWEQRLLR